MLFIAISGVPESPPAVPVVFWFRVATLAAATVPEAILSPLSAVRFEPSPTNDVAVTTPVTCTPLSPTVVALPNVETPETDKLSKNLTLVDVVILSVEATPVNPPPSPENDVAVTIPVTLSPLCPTVKIPTPADAALT